MRETVGTRIRFLRNEKNITQEELASYLSVTRPILSNWETGRTSVDSESLIKLADFFDVSADYLLCRSNIRKITYNIDDFLDELSDSDKRTIHAFIDFLKYRNKIK